MADKFQNKYRIPSARWQEWDYSSEGLYFITINVEHHACLLGSIVDKEMYLSEFGQIVVEEWHKSFEMRSELFCDAFVVMPNHIHAILRIEYPKSVITNDGINLRVEPHGRAALRDGNTNIHGKTSSIRDRNYGTGIAFREPKSISSFVGGYKSIVTKRINILRHSPGKKLWQDRFHDHVIRDYEECRRIGAYIETNITNWNDDRYFKE